MATYLYGSQEMMHMMNPVDVTATVATTAFLGTGWNPPSNYYGGIAYQENQHNLHQSILQNRNHLVGVPMTFGRTYHDDTGAAATSVVGSKYLRAAQNLLEEVVVIGKGVKEEEPPSRKPVVGAGGHAGEIAVGDRRDLQMKKTKLTHLLDEVEQRYRQYNKQMQVVIASFESVAGVGSARAYTTLALRTISKQFRCLRDAIADQIRAGGRVLGEECQKGSRGGSRLRYIDHHLSQQRTLQQLQHNAWRPQRGLPERSVSVLRAWLFEHFLHPYPKYSDKIMLAKQTGLTRNQVSNWFINARVRLWKPMVEEMYVQETTKERAANTDSRNKDDGDDESKSNGGYDDDLEEEEDIIQHPNFKKIKYNNPPRVTPIQHESGQSELFMGYGNHVYNLNLMTPLAYSVAELDRLSTNGVALTLGLSGDEHVASDQFNSPSDPAMIHSQSVYGKIESRKAFAAQLLPDFMA